MKTETLETATFEPTDLAPPFPDPTATLRLHHPAAQLRGFAWLHHAGYHLPITTWTLVAALPAPARRRLIPGAGLLIRRNPTTMDAAQAVCDLAEIPHQWPGCLHLPRDRAARLAHLRALDNELVAVLDTLTRQNPTLLALLRRHPRINATRPIDLRRALTLADPRAESRPETLLRLRAHAAGFTALTPQVRVTTPTGIYYIDLGDAYHQVGAEYQSHHHFTAHGRERDAQRMNALRNAGWRITEVTSNALFRPEAWARIEEDIRANYDHAHWERDWRWDRR